MLVFRHLMAASAGTAIALAYGIAANAQAINSVDRAKDNTKSEPLAVSEVEIFSENDLDGLFEYDRLVAQIAQMNSDEPTNDDRETPRETPEETPQETPGPFTRITNTEELDPSANPLLFPTEPEEVEVKKVRAITLEQATEIALRNNKQLKIARVTLERFQADLREQQAALFPTLDLGFDYRIVDSSSIELTNRGIALSNQQANLGDTVSERLTGDLIFDYDIYTGGRRGALIRQAELRVRRAEYDIEIASADLRFDVADDYYILQNADARVEIEQASVRDAEQSLRDARLLEQAGLGTRSSVLQAEVDLANNVQALTRAIARQRIARRQLAQTLGVGQQVELAAADEIQEAGIWNINLEQSIVLAYKNRAELEQRLLDREIADEDREIALSVLRPQIGFSFTYDILDDLRDEFNGTDGYTAALTFDWRLFDGGAAIARARRAEKDIELAELNFADQRHSIRFNIEQGFFNLQANKENIETTTKGIELAEENLRLARLRFQAGVGTQTEVINAQRDLTQARGNFLTAITEYNQSLNTLQRQVSNLPDSRLFQKP